jgi:ABC-type transport system involved in Fe-S cluster assembly fused permease/ATPase subunit
MKTRIFLLMMAFFLFCLPVIQAQDTRTDYDRYVTAMDAWANHVREKVGWDPYETPMDFANRHMAKSRWDKEAQTSNWLATRDQIIAEVTPKYNKAMAMMEEGRRAYIESQKHISH